MVRPVVTIDGLAGSGKSSIAFELARRLGFALLNSGLLYRSIGVSALQRCIPLEDEGALILLTEKLHPKLELNDAGESTVCTTEGVLEIPELSAPSVSDAASKISGFEGVRRALMSAQRDAFLSAPGLVAEGRDMGTVVFPDANLKFFVETPLELRISRRLSQLAKTTGESEDELKKRIKIEILERDQRDIARAVAPTIAAPDAIKVANGEVSLTQVVENLYDFASRRGLASKLVK